MGIHEMPYAIYFPFIRSYSGSFDFNFETRLESASQIYVNL